MAHSAKKRFLRRFARGINKTSTGVSKKFGRMRPNADLAGKVSDHGYENAILGGALAAGGLGAMSREKKRQKLMRQGVRFSGEHYEDLIEFSMQPGIDPNLVQSLLDEASRIEQEGQTKIVISRQLYEQVQAALQEFTMQKQQIDGASVQRIQQQGFSAGYDLIKF
jgi:hypothetical protein